MHVQGRGWRSITKMYQSPLLWNVYWLLKKSARLGILKLWCDKFNSHRWVKIDCLIFTSTEKPLFTFLITAPKLLLIIFVTDTCRSLTVGFACLILLTFCMRKSLKLKNQFKENCNLSPDQKIPWFSWSLYSFKIQSLIYICLSQFLSVDYV